MYSIFVVPTGTLKAKLLKTIKRLGGPVFVPHLTLLGPIHLDASAVVHRTRQFANQQKRFFVKFQNVSYCKDLYFQCVFITCAKTEDLMSAHQAAREVFEFEGDSFTPHVSLTYSDMDENQRIKTAEQVSEWFYKGEEGNEADLLYETGFWVDEIELWEIFPEDKQLKNWKLIESFSLTQN